MPRFPPPAHLGPAGSGGASSSTSSPLALTIANVGSQSGSHWTDDGSDLKATWPNGTTGVQGQNNNTWGDILIWDLSDLFGEDILVSASPMLALDWDTSSNPGAATILGFGFCTAANLAGAAIQTNSRWVNLYNDGANEEGVTAKRNQSTGATATVKASPTIARCTPVLLGNKWAYALASLAHGDTGINPVTQVQSSTNAVTSTHRIYAWLAGGPASAAASEIVHKGTLTVHYGGATS